MNAYVGGVVDVVHSNVLLIILKKFNEDYNNMFNTYNSSLIDMSDEKTWLEEIIEAYRELGGSAHYSDLYDYIDKTTSRSLTNSWKATIRRKIETYSSDSDNFKGKEDIFYSVDGIGKGVWGLREYVDKET